MAGAGFHISTTCAGGHVFSARGRGSGIRFNGSGTPPVGGELLANSDAGRKPMLLFVFVRGLLRFNAARPALLPLFQLPPRYGRTSHA